MQFFSRLIQWYRARTAIQAAHLDLGRDSETGKEYAAARLIIRAFRLSWQEIRSLTEVMHRNGQRFGPTTISCKVEIGGEAKVYKGVDAMPSEPGDIGSKDATIQIKAVTRDDKGNDSIWQRVIFERKRYPATGDGVLAHLCYRAGKVSEIGVYANSKSEAGDVLAGILDGVRSSAVKYHHIGNLWYIGLFVTWFGFGSYYLFTVFEKYLSISSTLAKIFIYIILWELIFLAFAAFVPVRVNLLSFNDVEVRTYGVVRKYVILRRCLMIISSAIPLFLYIYLAFG